MWSKYQKSFQSVEKSCNGRLVLFFCPRVSEHSTYHNYFYWQCYIAELWFSSDKTDLFWIVRKSVFIWLLYLNILNFYLFFILSSLFFVLYYVFFRRVKKTKNRRKVQKTNDSRRDTRTENQHSRRHETHVTTSTNPSQSGRLSSTRTDACRGSKLLFER